MRYRQGLIAATSIYVVLAGPSHSAQFDNYGAAAPAFVAIDPSPNFIVELGLGVGAAPAYEGASDYEMTFNPIVKVERLLIPGLIDIGGSGSTRGGFSFAPSISIASERKSDDHAAIAGLNNVDATYALGGRVGYEIVLTQVLSAEVFGAARYAFGGAEGFVGEVGANLTAKLTPQLEVTAGSTVAFASQDYMNTYFGVSSEESIATGGRLEAYAPDAGIKSVGINLTAKYEFVPDTFVSMNASYSRYAGDASKSPIVKAGNEDQFTVGLGLSRRLAF